MASKDGRIPLPLHTFANASELDKSLSNTYFDNEAEEPQSPTDATMPRLITNPITLPNTKVGPFIADHPAITAHHRHPGEIDHSLIAELAKKNAKLKKDKNRNKK